MPPSLIGMFGVVIMDNSIFSDILFAYEYWIFSVIPILNGGYPHYFDHCIVAFVFAFDFTQFACFIEL